MDPRRSRLFHAIVKVGLALTAACGGSEAPGDGGSDAVAAPDSDPMPSDGAPRAADGNADTNVTDADRAEADSDAAADAPGDSAVCLRCNDAGCFPCFV